MDKAGIIFAFLLIKLTLNWGHEIKRINSLDKKIKNKLGKLRGELQGTRKELSDTRDEFLDEIEDAKETILSVLTGDLPEVIETTLFELLRSGRIESISRHHAQSEIKSLKRSVNQLKAGLHALRRKLELSENEQATQKAEMKRIRRKLEEVEEDNHLLKSVMYNNSCQCEQDHQSNAVVMTSSRTDVTAPKPRLLAVGWREDQFYQFDLKTLTKTKYPLESGNVRDVVFDPVSQNIIWANESEAHRNESGIFTVHIDGGQVTSLMKGIVPNCLAVDDDVIFVGTTWPKVAIGTFSRSSKRYTEIADVSKYGEFVNYLTLDPGKRLIFSTYGYVLVQMDYDGTNRRVIVRDLVIIAATFVPSSRFIYYSVFKTVYRISLIGQGKAEKILEFDDYVHSIVHDRGVLYTGDMFHGNVRVTDLKTKNTTIIHTFEPTFVSVCFIP